VSTALAFLVGLLVLWWILRARRLWRLEVLGWAKIYRVEPMPGESTADLLYRIASKARAVRGIP
jgi:hypothetical protein